MTRMVYLGVAATMLLACAPTVAQEKAEAPDASVVNETTAPTAAAMMGTEEAVAEETEATPVAAAMPADPIVCKRGNVERLVNVVSPATEGRVCEVHYAKPTEGVDSRVLWFATADKGFCDDKANTLMAKLTTAGFSCNNPDGTAVTIEASAAAPAPAPAPVEEAAAETAPAMIEAGMPSEPEEPADAPESSEEPADEPAEGDQQN